MSGPAFRVRELRVEYEDRVALRDLSFQGEASSVLALAGPNGSGKSTLLRAMVGLERATQGSIELGRHSLSDLDLPRRAREVAWMPQEEPAGDDLLVEEYVAYGRHPYRGTLGPETEADREAIAGAIATVGVEEFLGRRVWALSGGERQRVRLARVLAQQAPIVLLDEPTAHLDIAHQIDLLARLRNLAATHRTALVVALHDLNLAARFADQLLVLSLGRRVAIGSPREVLSPGLLREVWGISAELRRDPATDQPYLIPRLLPEPRPHPVPEAVPGQLHVHVLSGGGSAAELLPLLVQAGYDVSLGPVHLFDSDQVLAEELHLPTVVEVPFAPFSEETRRRTREFLAASDAVIVTPFPIGPGNLASLEEVALLPVERLVRVMAQAAGRTWDFTGGRAAELRQDILQRHPGEWANVEGLVRELWPPDAPLGRGAPPAGPRPSRPFA